MIFSFLQLITAVSIIGLILLQERSSGASGLLGGGDSTHSFYQARRGMERLVFRATIVLVIIFAVLSVFQLSA
jgi:protein translocase SecG subunit